MTAPVIGQTYRGFNGHPYTIVNITCDPASMQWMEITAPGCGTIIFPAADVAKWLKLNEPLDLPEHTTPTKEP